MKRLATVLALASVSVLGACSSSGTQHSIDPSTGAPKGYVILAVDRDNTAGYAKKSDLFGTIQPGAHLPKPGRDPAPVYKRDLKTVVGHWYSRKGYVPLGTDPNSVPDKPTATTAG